MTRPAINHNFGLPYEQFEYFDEDNRVDISGICVGDRSGEGAHVNNLKLIVEFDGHHFELHSIPDELRHKYSELLLEKWLEGQR